MSDPPCMSCGGSRSEPPVINEHGHCLDTRNHYTPEKHQVWVLLRDEDGKARYEIRGTGAIWPS